MRLGLPATALALLLAANAGMAQQSGDGTIGVAPLPNPVTGGPGVIGGIADQPLPGAQGGFVADGTGLGAVTDSSNPDTAPAPTPPEKVADAPGAVVRWLDKVSGQTVDITLGHGQAKSQGRLTIQLGQCRYPVDDPSSNAYAYLTIRDSRVAKPIFQGWMIASSPALNPLDSPRYDVWLLRCTTS